MGVDQIGRRLDESDDQTQFFAHLIFIDPLQLRSREAMQVERVHLLLDARERRGKGDEVLPPDPIPTDTRMHEQLVGNEESCRPE